MRIPGLNSKASVAESLVPPCTGNPFSKNATQWHQMLSLLPAAVYTCDQDGLITFYNARAIELWARSPELLSSEDRFCGSFRFFSSEGVFVPHDETPMAQVVRSGQALRNAEGIIEQPGGARIVCSISIDPLLDEDGVTCGAINVFHDITQHRETERELEFKEAQLRLVTDNAPVMIVHCDRNHRYLFANKPYTSRFNLRPEQVVGKHVSEVVGESAYKTLAHHMDATLAGATVEFEQLIPYDSIGLHWISAKFSPDKDEQGNVTGLVAAITDITERKRLGIKADELDMRYRTLIEHAGDGVFLADREGRFLSVNRAACQMLGYSAAEMMQLRVHDTYLPEEDEVLKGRMEDLRNGRSLRFERQMRRKDGSLIEVEVCVSMLTDGVAHAIARDITERKKAQSELQNFQWLVENSNDFIGMCDLEGKPFFVNHAGLQMVGLSSLQDVPGLHLRDFFFEEDRSCIEKEFIPRVLQEGQGLTEIRFRHFKSCEALWMIYSVSVLKNEHGAPIGFATISQNITERKKKEFALREQARLLDLSFDTILVRDIADRITYWNHGAEKLYGWSRDEAVGQQVHSLLRTVFPGSFDEITRQLQQSGRWEGELRHTRRDGTQVTVLTRWALDRDKDGKPAYILETNSDITERKRAEESLMRREAEFRQLADSMPQIVWAARADGTMDYYNRRWYEFTAAEYGAGDQSWVPMLHPEDREYSLETWHRSVKTGQPYEAECRFRSALTGDYKWHLVRALPIRNEKEEIIRWYGTATDISEQKQFQAKLRESGERLSASLEAAGTGTFRWDIRTNDLYSDVALDRLFGIQPGPNPRALGLFTDAIHPEDRPAIVSAIEKSATHGTDFSMEFRVVLPDGTIRWIDDRGKTFFGDDGKPEYMTGACVDVTERKRIENELREAQSQLELHTQELEMRVAERTGRLRETISELEAFSYTISHDLRAPLRSMNGFAQILMEDYGDGLDGPAKDYLRRIASAAGRLDKLIQEVLTYSRIPKMDLQLMPVDVHALVVDIVEQYPTFQLPAADVQIIGKLPTVFGQRSSITQCISNLLGNAVKFVAPGVTPRVLVRAEVMGEFVRFYFQDNGIGIAESDQRRIWGIFERLHPTKTYEGTGIGLAIARKTIEKMGGKVGVESKLGQGSTFWFELPKAD